MGPEKELPLLEVKRTVVLSGIFRFRVKPTITTVSFPDPVGNLKKRTWEIFPADPTFPYMSGSSQYLTKSGLKINPSDDGRAEVPLTKPYRGDIDIFEFVS